LSAPAARRARLLRLRTVEHRVAAARAVAADTAHAAVANVCDRVEQLRNGIGVAARGYIGHDLQSLCELSHRLDRARIGLQPSLDEAQAVREARGDERIAARIAEERLSRIHVKALQREAAEHDVRAASLLPTRVVRRVRLP